MENSKLSSRFNKKEVIPHTAPTKKFVFAKNAVENTEEQQNQPDLTNSTTLQNELNIEEIKERFLEKISSIPVWNEYADEEKHELAENFLELNYNTKDNEIITQLLDSVNGFGVIDYLIKQENVSAVFVNGTNNVYIEINGKVLNTEIKPNNNQLKLIITNIENLSGKKIDFSKNTTNLKYENLLISIISPQISLNGVCITVRKIIDSDINFLLNNNFATKEIFDFLISAINSKKNIVISGETNSGKTTFLNAILKDILSTKRLVLLENTPQINTKSEQTMNFLLDENSFHSNCLITNIEKLLPDYILTDLNSPLHQIPERNGIISTLCTSSPDSAFAKLVNSCILQNNLPDKNAKQSVLKNYDYIIQLNTIDGVRRISSIVELTPARTSALSIKTIATWANGIYETNFPQPLTSMVAETLYSQAGSMTARFSHQN